MWVATFNWKLLIDEELANRCVFVIYVEEALAIRPLL